MALSRDSAVAEADSVPGDGDEYFAKFKNKTDRTGRQYGSSTCGYQRDSARRRAFGGGRLKSCSVLREMLILWYNSIRHSVDVKIMCRFPKKVVLVKAQMLQQEYYASCLKNNLKPELVQVDRRLLRGFFAE